MAALQVHAAPTIALCLHGRISSWVGTKAHETRKEWLNASRRSLARLAADSIQRHIIKPSWHSGAPIGVFIHSWNPELASFLDGLYHPMQSQHDPINPQLRSVMSQHLSMKRCLGLVPESVRLIMVSRLDLLFFADVPLPALADAARRGPALWLPHVCQHDLDVPKAEQSAMFAECGCHAQPNLCTGISGKGWLVESPTVERLHARAPTREIHSLYVLDWWFVATPFTARSFGAIHDNFTNYVSSLGHRHFHGAPWAHFFWAHHVTHVVPMNVDVRFVALLSGRDFLLARFVRFGRDCEAPVRHPAHLARTANITATKRARRWIEPRLEDQCPQRLQQHATIMCPWDTPVCAGRHAESVVAALRRTEQALRQEGLPNEHAYDRFYIPRPLRQILESPRFSHVGGALDSG